MNAEEILKLIDAGYTKSEIESIMMPAQEPKQEPAQEPNQEPEQEPNQEPAQEQNQEVNPEIANLQNDLNAAKKQIEQLTKQMQQMNRETKSLETMPDDIPKKADAAMAELIRPTMKKRGS